MGTTLSNVGESFNTRFFIRGKHINLQKCGKNLSMDGINAINVNLNSIIIVLNLYVANTHVFNKTAKEGRECILVGQMTVTKLNYTDMNIPAKNT